MSSIYLHIPFCRKACFYCNFHFSTSTKHQEAMVDAICEELVLQKDFFSKNETLKTLYLGGGTPSLLSALQIEKIFEVIYKYFTPDKNIEITLEANPEDLSKNYLKDLKTLSINRMSIGVQSFSDKDLSEIGRIHSGAAAIKALKSCCEIFENISIDLIYGFPEMSEENWKKNLETAISFGTPHLSAYALTIEPKTILETKIKKKHYPALEDSLAEKHYFILLDEVEKHGYLRYEFSNFGKEGYFSKANSAYWEGKNYLGVGPSAHSYNGKIRSWNISNNMKYLESIKSQKIPKTQEILSPKDHYNEYIMTRLRTSKGIDLDEVFHKFGENALKYLRKNLSRDTNSNFLIQQNRVTIQPKSYFFTDGLAAGLFMI